MTDDTRLWTDEMDDAPELLPVICSHRWIDPNDPPIQRASYSPAIGPRRREMKFDTLYQCQHCGMITKTTKKVQ